MKLPEEQVVVKNTKQFCCVTAAWIAVPVVIIIIALMYG